MPVAARKNTVSENETPIDSTKYNQEIDNIYTVLNQVLKFYASPTSPENPQTNQTWLDTTTIPALLRRFDGTVWRWTGISLGDTIPINPAPGAFHINLTARTMGYWDGSAWIGLPGTAVAFDPAGTDMSSTNLEAALKELAVGYAAAVAAAATALGAASDAGTYAGQAQTAKTASETAQSGAQTAKTGAETAQGASETARDLAQKWASEVEDTPVSGGEYSAKHYAAKAAESASSAGQLWEVSGGVTRLITADVIDARSEKITNVATPTADGDAVNKGHLDSQLSGKASTDAATTSTAGLMSAADKVRLDALELKALTIASIESY